MELFHSVLIQRREEKRQQYVDYQGSLVPQNYTQCPVVADESIPMAAVLCQRD